MNTEPRVSLERHHVFDLKYRLGDLRHSAVPGSMIVRVVPSRVLILAPHSVTHRRGGGEKVAEFWTGAIAETLAEVLGVSFISSIGQREELSDAATEDSFARLARQVIDENGVNWIVDIHGLSPARGIDINVGTAGCREAGGLDRFVGHLSGHFSTSVDDPFDGTTGLSAYLSDNEKGVYGVQLELGPRLRSDAVSAVDLDILASAISEWTGASRSSSPATTAR